MAFVSGPEYAARAEAAGFEAFAAGIPLAELERRFAPIRRALQDGIVPIDERRPIAFSRRFAEIEAPAKLDDLRELVHSWRPAIVVHESADLAAPVAAAEHGVPSVHHSFGRAIPLPALRRAAESAAPMWERAGLPPDEWAGAYRGTYVDICPPSFGGEAPPAGTPVRQLRPADARPGVRDGRPLVYVTLGTIFNRIDLFRVLLDAFAEVDCEVVMTVGQNVDPAELGPLPQNARVEGYVPQSEILPRARAVVAHGGSGSTLGAFAHGCPVVFVPQGADQFENAVAGAETGAGIALLPPQQNHAELRDALERVLGEAHHAEAAQRLAAEIAAMPSAEHVAAALFAA